MTESPLLDSENAMLGVFLDCVVDFRKWLLRGRKNAAGRQFFPDPLRIFAQGFARRVTDAAQLGEADGVSLCRGLAHLREPVLSKTIKHHWYGETSPLAEQRTQHHDSFMSPSWQPAAPKTVIIDRENPPQIQPKRIAED